jgi:4-deoxy-L-threo-5-hexosulose-uronate ketol-isomerase
MSRERSTWFMSISTGPSWASRRRWRCHFLNLAQDAVAFHLMGPPEETRHILVKDFQAVVSPGWSIHAGVGTRAYSFCWGMGGENQDYADMDAAPITKLR